MLKKLWFRTVAILSIPTLIALLPDVSEAELLHLDGDGDAVQVEHADTLVMTSALTIEAEIYPQGPGSGYTDEWLSGTGPIIQRFPGDGGMIVNKESEYEISRFADGTIRFAIANEEPGWDWINTGYVVPEGTRARIAFTYQGSTGTFRFFADGVEVFTETGKGNIGDVHEQNSLRIGGRSMGGRGKGTTYFDGLIDEVRVWNIARLLGWQKQPR